MRAIIAFFMGFIFISQANAEYTEKEKMTKALAQIIVAEKFCGFEYDQQAISDYISKTVAPDDKMFYQDLNLQMHFIKSMDIPSMQEPSAKVVFCTVAHNMASSLGFVSK